MPDPIQILERVNSFYSGAFTQLVTYTVALLAFVGVLIPILIEYIHNRTFRIEYEGTRRKLAEDLESLKVQISQDIRSTLKKDLKKEFDGMVEQATSNLKAKVSNAHGGIFHLQGNSTVATGNYPSACHDFCRAGEFYLESQDQTDAQRVLTALATSCLANMDKQDFDQDATLESDIKGLIASVRKHNDHGAFSDFIDKVETSLATALKRAKSQSPTSWPGGKKP